MRIHRSAIYPAAFLALILLALGFVVARPRAEIRPRPHLSLAQRTYRVTTEKLPTGETEIKRVFKEAIPWDEYVEALNEEKSKLSGSGRRAAETPLSLPSSRLRTQGLVGLESTNVMCAPPLDGDFDGDGFTDATVPTDDRPERSGSYVGDRPRITAEFDTKIEPSITYHYNGSTEILTEMQSFHQDNVLIKTAVKEALEIISKFSTPGGIKLGFGLKLKKPFFSLSDVNVVFETQRNRNYAWTRETTHDIETRFSNLRTLKKSNIVTVNENDGKVTGSFRLMNVSDYPITIDVTNFTILVVAFSPFTGVKHVIADITIPDTLTLGWGENNNFVSRPAQLVGVNTNDMLDSLAEGWVYDFELAGGYTVTDHSTGADVGALISRINGRNARISIIYGDTTPRQYGQVSVYQPGSACLTARDMLTTYVGAANVDFGRMPDNTLIVTRINHRANKWADQDFDDLTPAQQAEYGRWVVGFRYATQPLTTLDMENTLIFPEDKIYFYYLTANDYRDDARPPDVQPSFTVANDGTSPSEMVVATAVNTNDLVQLNVQGAFQIEQAYSQSAGTVAACGKMIYKATYYGHRVQYDSRNHSITVPNADFYGLQIKFGGLGWMTLADLLADPTAGAKVVSFRGYPYYDFAIQFRATPSLLANYPTRNLQVRNVKPRQTFPQVGWSGFDVQGRTTTCYHSETGGFFHDTGTVSVWYRLENTDLDLDGFATTDRTGLDFDDANARRFPYAPEHLDGVDNDGDTLVDNHPLICPSELKSYDSGTCKIDDRMGWYGPTPNVSMDRRWNRTDGTSTAWEAIGSGVLKYDFTMLPDPANASLEVRLTHYPAGGGVFSGSNLVQRVPGGGIPVFGVGQDFEAEAGALILPMKAATSGPDTYVSVPAGSANPSQASAEYRVSIGTSGDYVIWSRVYASGSSDNSFLVTVTDPAGGGVNFGFGTNASFQFDKAAPNYSSGAFGWTQVGHYDASVSPTQNLNPIVYHLAAGTYTIRFRALELGARLDKIRVDRYCVDADADGYTTCAGDCNDANRAVNPGHAEDCATPVDDNCNGSVNEGCSSGGGGSPIFIKVKN